MPAASGRAARKEVSLVERGDAVPIGSDRRETRNPRTAVLASGRIQVYQQSSTRQPTIACGLTFAVPALRWRTL